MREVENRRLGLKSISLNGISVRFGYPENIGGRGRRSLKPGPCGRGRIREPEGGNGISPSWASKATSLAEGPRAASSHRKPQGSGTPSLQGAAPTARPLRGGPRGQQPTAEKGVPSGARGCGQAGEARRARGPAHFRLSARGPSRQEIFGGFAGGRWPRMRSESLQGPESVVSAPPSHNSRHRHGLPNESSK